MGFNLGQAQVDYVQHLFLYFLYRRIKDELVFKGGTCLQKTFGLDRFSEDLDFTMKGRSDVAGVARDITAFGYGAEASKDKEDEFGVSYLLKARGPLYDGTEKSLAFVRMEMSVREEAVLEPEVKTVTPIYHDLPPYTIAAMRVEEILAEKLRATTIRDKARDVYDLWFMLKKGVHVDFELMNEKLGFYGAVFDFESFVGLLHKRRRIWEKELGPIIPRVPDFAGVAGEIEERLAEL